MVNGTDVQNNLDLRNRAFIAAYMNNAYLAFYYNLSDTKQTYMTSKIGDSYKVGYNEQTPLYWDRLHTSQFFSDFLQAPDPDYNLTTGLSGLTFVPPNPWNLTRNDFAQIRKCYGVSKRAY